MSVCVCVSVGRIHNETGVNFMRVVTVYVADHEHPGCCIVSL